MISTQLRKKAYKSLRKILISFGQTPYLITGKLDLRESRDENMPLIADVFDPRMTSDGELEMHIAPEDCFDRVDEHGYFGQMRRKFDVGGSMCVYVIELESTVWEESLLKAGPKQGQAWIPSFPMDLDDPKITKTENWKLLDNEGAEGYVYVGKTQLKGEVTKFRTAIRDRHEQHVNGAEYQYRGKQKPHPLISIHGSKESNIWDLNRCIIGIWESEIANKLESWYGWALGQAGYVVYGPNIHRKLVSTRQGGGKIKPFIGDNPFW